jgi:hypothetical protein
MDHDLDRLSILERAQLLHDATLVRHGEMLDRHEDHLARHEEQLVLLRGIVERQDRLMAQLVGVSSRLEQTLEAIKDLLTRGNGRET